MAISSAMPFQKKFATVMGKQMAYVEEPGDGENTFVFLHGNPTSSFLWRNVMVGLQAHGSESIGRLIAPDLIGMGDSDKLDNPGPDSYRFVEHRHYLDALLEELGVNSNVVLVIHDWGSALGFDWARRHQEAMKGICYMEAIVRPVSWDDWPESARGIFEAMRSDGGEEMVLQKNLFVDRILPASILRELTDEEQAVYGAPYTEPGESRRPTLTWPREIPLGGSPADVVQIAQDYADWLVGSPLPKLFINADPGTILTGPQREFCRSWPNQTEVTVKGLHFIQEDSPDEISSALAAWIKTTG